MPITGNETKPLVKTAMPGPKTKAIVERDTAAIATTTKTAPISAVAGRGVVVEDADGNRLLDFASGIGVLNTGHSHPKVVRAIQDQATRLIHFAGTDYYYDQQVTLAERLGAIVPIKGATKTFYTQSGTESNEAAIKVAKAATGRPMFLAFLGAFHGRTQGSLSLTASKPKHKAGFFPSMPGVVHVPFANPYRNAWAIDGYADPKELTNRTLEYIEKVFDTIAPPQDVAGCFWEPVQGEGGYVVPPMDFPKQLAKLLRGHGILLQADEVQTGFGRTGKMFATEHYGITVDTVSLAKAMGSGYPIGACVMRKGLDFKQSGMHSNTFGGNVLGCTAALATLDAFEEDHLLQNAVKTGHHLEKRLDELTQKDATIGDHRGLGLMRALEFVDATKKKDGVAAPDPKRRDAVEEACWKRGLILLSCGKSSLRVIPSLNVNTAQIDGAMDVLAQALKAA